MSPDEDSGEFPVGPALRHLDGRGRPLCGVDAEGSLLVDQPVDTTCPACLVSISCRLAAQRRGQTA